jgi:hypothetical protein
LRRGNPTLITGIHTGIPPSSTILRVNADILPRQRSSSLNDAKLILGLNYSLMEYDHGLAIPKEMTKSVIDSAGENRAAAKFRDAPDQPGEAN